MNKRELIVEASRKIGVPQRDVDRCVNAFLETMSKHLLKEECITLHRFGYFYIQTLGERNVYSPITGKNTIAKARKKIKFKPSPNLKFGE